MCDYSLNHFPNRLAHEGETLVVHRFPSTTLGLASSVDLQAPPNAKAGQSRRGFWARVRDFFIMPEAKAVPAVCVPPGARLLLQGIPAHLREELNVRSEEEVVFTQLGADAFSYRDAVRFSSGREVLLQRLKEGQRALVLNLSLPDELPQREELVAATPGGWAR
jgi:hypothetical protein